MQQIGHLTYARTPPRGPRGRDPVPAKCGRLFGVCTPRSGFDRSATERKRRINLGRCTVADVVGPAPRGAENARMAAKQIKYGHCLSFHSITSTNRKNVK